MQIIFQYTLTDIRRFIAEYQYLNKLPIFDSNKYEDEVEDEYYPREAPFIRSTGHFYPRKPGNKKRSITKEFLQAYDFAARRSIQLPE